jgi:hypothetical protein
MACGWVGERHAGRGRREIDVVGQDRTWRDDLYDMGGIEM